MADTAITRTALEASRADIDRVTVRRHARDVAKQAMRSRKTSVLRAGRLILDFLEDEADAQRNALAEHQTLEQMRFWEESQAAWLREIRSETASLESLLAWRMK